MAAKKDKSRSARKPERKTASPRDPEPARAAAADPTPSFVVPRAPGFPIIGIGASAGGLEALELFLRHVPAHSGAAYVVVQHLDPMHKGMLVELLQRATTLDVVEAVDGVQVEAEHVYVIAPGMDMSLLHGSLHLLPQTASRGRMLPIDFFFRSLAQDQGERSIGVILSGMGSDGTLGLRAIKEAAGASFVQSPESAKFDSMPRSAIDAGLADVVATVEEIPSRILSYRDHAPFISGEHEVRSADAQTAVDRICVLLRDFSGNDFSLYKRSTIYRRMERRMGLHQIETFNEYLRFLRDNPREVELLFKELLIGVTSFFRDPSEWERLRKEVLPALVTARASTGVLRAWVPGCSTGEEAYSLAILFKEAVEPIKSLKSISIQIFATDLDRDAIEKARNGLYPENIAADVSQERLRRFFVREEGGYRVSKDIRETVVFAPQNVIVDPPFTKVDIVTCRNLLIYLSAEVQKKLIPLFHYCLAPGGTLFLGTAETVGSFTNLFVPLDGRTRLYRRLDQGVAVLPVEMQFNAVGRTLPKGEREEPLPPAKTPAANIQAIVDRLIVQRFAPLGVLCNTKGDILYISGRAGKYFEPAVGKANLNVMAMAREGLRYELANAFAKALRYDRTVTVRGIKVGTNGGAQDVNLTVQKLADPKELAGTVIVIISDVVPPEKPAPAHKGRKKAGPRVVELEDELQRSREEVQTVREEMQTSQEELKSTNEELQSTNEELQSTNEELTTSKEEMQSLNEELQTVNHELQSKVDELSRSNNDMKNLLNSTDIATLFLDQDLRVRRFTTATAKIIKLIPADIGRPITDIASDLDYPTLSDDARDVLRTLIFKEKQALTRDARAYAVRIMPYRTLENVIDGVVIKFMDTSAARALEVAAKEQASQLRQLTESLPTLVWGPRADGAFEYISRQWLDYTGVPDVEQVQWGWLDQVHPADRDRVRDDWRGTVRAGASFDSEFRLRSGDGTYRWFKTRSAPIRDSAGSIVKWYGTSTEIDQLKRAEDRLSSLAHVIPNAVLGLDRELMVRSANAAGCRLVGLTQQQLIGRAIGMIVDDAAGLDAAVRHAPGQATLLVSGTNHSVRVEPDGDSGFWLIAEVDG